MYGGLDPPGERSPRHAEATHAVARHLVDGSVEALPHFNTNPPAILRVLNLASRGRADALRGPMRELPEDLATELWRAVERRVRDPAALSPMERRRASDLMLRLGYPTEAARLLDLSDPDPHRHVFTGDSAVEQLSVLLRLPHDRRALEERALLAAGDRRLSPRIRFVMASFVVVRNGRRGENGPAVRRAATLVENAVTEYEGDPFAGNLALQTAYRALAYAPFLRGDAEETFRLLEQATEHQRLAHSAIDDDLAELAWIDHAFPLFETLARTHLVMGSPDEAVAASGELIRLSPNDPRAWAAHGRALVGAGRIEDAIAAYESAIPLGGLPVGRAAYHLAWLHADLGRRDTARSYHRLAARVDPTVPALDALAERCRGPAGG